MNLTDIKNHQLAIKQKLIDIPEGFILDDTYACVICQKRVSGDKGWYDNNGPKCLVCQEAIKKGTIPSNICLNRTSWLAMWEVLQLGYHPMVIRMLIRKRKLKVRIIRDFQDKLYFYVFLKRENPLLHK